MKFVLALWALLLLAAAARGNPLPDKSSEEDMDSFMLSNNKLVLNKTNFFIDEYIKYRGEHTITNLVLAFNGDLFDDEDNSNPDPVLFFNQIDIKPDGARVELGQFVLVNGTAQKIFDGRCSTTDIGKPGVYFGAKDGLYVYNETTKGADKLGTVTDSIVQLQISNSTNEIYILTEPDYRIYKVNREGTQKTLVEAIPSAETFVLDRNNNIYYYGENKVPYVLSVGSTVPVEFSTFADVENPVLVRPAILVTSGAVFVVGEEVYMLRPNGTAQLTPFELKVKITSVSADAAILQYYALDNNIYEFNFIEIILKAIFGGLQELLDELKEKVKPYITNNEV